jgi:hypothetical protein
MSTLESNTESGSKADETEATAAEEETKPEEQ